MYDTAQLSSFFTRPEATLADGPVPLRQIAETRRAFPDAIIVFEVEVEAPDLLVGLQRCAAAFARSGLELKALRCVSRGRISCRLADRDGAQLVLLRSDLSGPEARIESWTTVIGGSNAAG